MEDDSRKLIRCTVTNKNNVASMRWVELSSFKLWRYMMTNRHGMQVDDCRPCLWMGQKYYAQRESILDHSGEVLNVDCIQLSIFDEANGFLEHVARFALREDTLRVKDLLMGHVSDQVKKKNGVDVQVYSGVCVAKYGDGSHLNLGLNNDL